MSERFGVAGSAGSPSVAGEPFGALWNPSSTITLAVLATELLSGAAANINAELHRITARGTPASTVTPDADNHFDRLIAPTSGALLDLADYSANATIDASVIRRARTPAVIGSGLMAAWPENRPLLIPPGTGLAWIDQTGVIAGVIVGFEWIE